MVFIIRDRAEQDRSGAPAPARAADEPLSYTVSGNDKACPAPPHLWITLQVAEKSLLQSTLARI